MGTREYLSDSWECMANLLRRAGIFISNLWYQFVDWLDDNVICCCEGENSDPGERDRRKPFKHPTSKLNFKTTNLPVNNLNTKTIKSRIDQHVVKSTIPTLKLSEQGSSTSHQPMPQSSSSQQSPPIATASPQIMPGQSNKLIIKSINQPVGPNPGNQGVISSEPPRIDFVETGSIFGDRKKVGIDHNLLKLDNGRFRSPGLSKTIIGPNGRTIRVSFITGFPPLESKHVKSLDSSRSLPSLASKRSKQSVDSIPVGQGGIAAGKGSLEAPTSKSKTLTNSVSSLENYDSNPETVDKSVNK